jgi:Flp pilus assembly pilin Flp
MEFLVGVAKEYGLFVALVCFVLWTNWVRENRYINIIQTLSEEVKERLTKIEIQIKKHL